MTVTRSKQVEGEEYELFHTEIQSGGVPVRCHAGVMPRGLAQRTGPGGR